MAVETAPPLDEMEFVNPYKAFQKSERVPVYTGIAIENLKTLELTPWARKGGRGAYINLDGSGGTLDAYVLEIAPAGSSTPEHHMFEELVFVAEGRGSTSVWYEERRKVTFEWGRGSLFAVPLNATFQHFNSHGQQSARLLSVTTAPTIFSLFHNEKFIFGDPFTFDDRFAGEDDYFGEEKLFQGHVMQANFLPDTVNMELHEWLTRGAGQRTLMFEMGHNTLAAHISEFPVGTYKKAHRHGPGAHVIILSGEGYSLMWPAGAEPQRVAWRPGSLIVPPDAWFHQHFNAGAEPARYLALRWGSRRWDTGGAFTPDAHLADVDVSQGGWQIEYKDEDRAVHTLFEEQLAQVGATCHMRSAIPWCTGEELSR